MTWESALFYPLCNSITVMNVLFTTDTSFRPAQSYVSLPHHKASKLPPFTEKRYIKGPEWHKINYEDTLFLPLTQPRSEEYSVAQNNICCRLQASCCCCCLSARHRGSKRKEPMKNKREIQYGLQFFVLLAWDLWNIYKIFLSRPK